MLIKILILLLLSSFWYFGGQHKKKWIRKFLFCFGLGIILGILTKNFWVGLISAATYEITGLGYGNFELGEKNSLLGNLTKDHNGWYVRALWALIIGIVGPLGLVFWGNLAIMTYFVYIIYNTLISYLVSRLRLPVLLTDLAVGVGIASIVFLV